MAKLAAFYRSERISRICGKASVTKRRVRFFIQAMGFRFRLHGAQLPGNPDTVLASVATIANARSNDGDARNSKARIDKHPVNRNMTELLRAFFAEL